MNSSPSPPLTTTACVIMKPRRFSGTYLFILEPRSAGARQPMLAMPRLYETFANLLAGDPARTAQLSYLGPGATALGGAIELLGTKEHGVCVV
jgi:hypothetical protein